MKKAFWILGQCLLGASVAVLVANAQVTNGGGTASPGFIVYPSPIPPTPIPPDSGFLQFNNLVIESVSSQSIPTVIVASYGNYPIPLMEGGGSVPGATPAAPATATAPTGAMPTIQKMKCYRFDTEHSASGNAVQCPTPPPRASGSSTAPAVTPNVYSGTKGAGPAIYPMPGRYPIAAYQIKVDASTQLFLRDRTPGTLADFAAGDEINVFGYYNADGSIQAYLVRNLSKPVQKEFIQLNNVDLISISGTLAPATLIVVQRQNFPCYGFGEGGAVRRDIVCPLGMQSLTRNSAAGNAPIPPSIAPIWDMVRKYEVRVDAQTIILDRNHTRLPLPSLRVGDQLNIYGATSDNGQTLDADIVRDLSIPPAAITIGGTVTQVNADGSFVIQSDDGRTITVQNPVQAGVRVKLTGVLDTLANILSQVSNIMIGALNPTPIGPLPLGPLPPTRVRGDGPLPAGPGGMPNTQN